VKRLDERREDCSGVLPLFSAKELVLLLATQPMLMPKAREPAIGTRGFKFMASLWDTYLTDGGEEIFQMKRCLYLGSVIDELVYGGFILREAGEGAESALDELLIDGVGEIRIEIDVVRLGV